ncbi:MAG: nuclear transport factor 2 family protein [Acidobacteriota bacterium]
MSKNESRRTRTTKLVLLGAGVASVAALVATACSSGRKIDLVGKGREALAETESNGRAAMAGPPETVDASVTRFRALFADFHPQAVASHATALYAPDAYFNDGFVELKGSRAIADYFARSAKATESIDVQVEQTTRTEDGVYLRWIMTYTIHHRKTTIVAPGISHLRFTPDGHISYHRDYWDGSGALAEIVPLTGPILRAVKSRL